MARPVTPLTIKEIESETKKMKAAKDNGKAKDKVLSDGNGLQLRIRNNCSFLWNFNCIHPITKKRINMGLGTYPELSLANARKAASDARELVAQKIDPKTHRDSLRLGQLSLTEHTLFNISKEWFERKKDSITPAYAEDVWGSFERHIFPHIAKTPISQITAPQVITLLRPLESKGSLETVKRLIQRLNEVMTYAVNGGLVHSNPLSGIRANFRKPKKENMASLKPGELPELMKAIAHASIKRTTRCLIEWQLHTMTRPAEAAGAKWKEIDLDKQIWTIPPERMKKRREHVIPLNVHTINLLEVMRPISGHREHVFPADREPTTHCNSQTANMALKRMGFAGRLVSHGLRSIASTALNEEGFEVDLIEAALAHSDENQVRSAYNRANYLERRRPMMVWWSEYIHKASEGTLSITGMKSISMISEQT